MSDLLAPSGCKPTSFTWVENASSRIVVLARLLYIVVCVCKVVSACLHCVLGSFGCVQDASEHSLQELCVA